MKAPFLVLKKSCGEAVSWITDRLSQSGLQVIQTFDLSLASIGCSQCTCRYHGTEQCDCRMVVLLIYENGLPPVSLVVHGHNGQTWFTLADSPGRSGNPKLGTVIQDVLAPHIFALKLDDLANAA